MYFLEHYLEDINNVKHNTIDDFIFYLRNTLDNSPKTRNRKLSSLRNFFKYLSDNNLINNNPTINTKYATVGKRNPKYLTLNVALTAVLYKNWFDKQLHK